MGRQVITAQWRILLLLAACLASGCTDATAPGGSLLLAVSPDSIRFDAASKTGSVAYTIQNANSFRILTTFYPYVQTETSPNVWATLDTAYASFFFNSADSPMPANSTAQRQASLRLNPGRYRLHAVYMRSDSSGAALGTPQESLSNVFVVIP